MPVAAMAAIRFVGSKVLPCSLLDPEVELVVELSPRGRIERCDKDASLGRAFLYHFSGDSNYEALI